MKESTLLGTALVVALLGLFLLAIFSARLVVEEQSIVSISELEESKNVRVSGIVSSVKEGNKSTVIEIEEMAKTKIVVFDPIEGLKVGDKIAVEGKVDEFDGRKQVLAEKIGKVG